MEEPSKKMEGLGKYPHLLLKIVGFAHLEFATTIASALKDITSHRSYQLCINNCPLKKCECWCHCGGEKCRNRSVLPCRLCHAVRNAIAQEIDDDFHWPWPW